MAAFTILVIFLTRKTHLRHGFVEIDKTKLTQKKEIEVNIYLVFGWVRRFKAFMQRLREKADMITYKCKTSLEKIMQFKKMG